MPSSKSKKRDRRAEYAARNKQRRAIRAARKLLPKANSEIERITSIKEIDLVRNPPHYTLMKPQPLDVAEAWGLDLHRGQALLYIARAPHKGDPITDLKKAVNILQRKIALLERGK